MSISGWSLALVGTALVTGCDALGPKRSTPVASIEISADNNELTSVTTEVTLTVELRHADGRAFDTVEARGKRVTWSAVGGAQSSLISTGALSATVRLLGAVSSLTSLDTIGVEATVDGATDQISLLVCPVQRVGIKASETMLLGRTAPLVGSGYARMAYDPGFAPTGAPVAWSSSDASVLALRDGNMTAAGTGTAILTAVSCGVTDSISVSVLTNGYRLTPIYTTEQSQDRAAGTINDAGQIVGSVPGQAYNFLWDAGSFTDLEDCKPVSINNASQILCQAAGPTVWENGVATARDTFSTSGGRINDLGHVLLSRALWRGPGDVIHLDPMPGGWGYLRDLNNKDEIIGTNGFLYFDPFFWREGQWLSMAPVGHYATASALNDSGDVVGLMAGIRTEARDDAYFGRSVNDWRAETLRPSEVISYWYPFNDVTTDARSINNHRDIVGNGSQGPFLWSAGRLSLLNQIVDDDSWVILDVGRINNRGQIVAYARKVTDLPPQPCMFFCNPRTSLVLLDPP